jgi:hypothetical protein
MRINCLLISIDSHSRLREYENHFAGHPSSLHCNRARHLSLEYFSLVKPNATYDLIATNIDRGRHPSHITALSILISPHQNLQVVQIRRGGNCHGSLCRLLAHKTGMEQRLDPQCLGTANISGADVGQAEVPQRYSGWQLGIDQVG